MQLLWMFLLSLGFPTQAFDFFPFLKNAETSLKRVEEFNTYTAPPCEAGEPPGCLSLVENFCDQLYSPKNNGNITLTSPGGKIQIRMGNTKNQINYAVYELAKAKLLHRDRLPPDFKERLASRGYFEKLGTWLSKKPTKKMSMPEFDASFSLINELTSIWNTEYELALTHRVEKESPGYKNFSDPEKMPPAMRKTARLKELQFDSEIYGAIWSEDPSWKKIEADFAKIQKLYVDEISRMTGISEQLRGDWIDRVQTIDLIVPGENAEDVDTKCFSTVLNAYYVRSKHKLAVCAGLFTGMDSSLVLAHEVGHALDLNQSVYRFIKNSPLSNDLATWVKRSCKNDYSRCSEWENFKSDYQTRVSEFNRFEIPLPEFMTCLQKQEIKTTPSPEYLDQQATRQKGLWLAYLADNNIFLNLAVPQLNTHGATYANPSYLNPCGEDIFDQSRRYSDAFYFLEAIFAHEYKCNPAKTDEERFRAAIDLTGKLQEAYLRRTTNIAGKFSEDTSLKTAGYAEQVAEQMADYLGTRVMKAYLSESSSVEHRRNQFFASMALFCNPKTAAERYPTLANIQKEYGVEEHSLDQARRQELLTLSIREALGCKKDFSREDCEIK